MSNAYYYKLGYKQGAKGDTDPYSWGDLLTAQFETDEEEAARRQGHADGLRDYLRAQTEKEVKNG